MGSGSPVSQGAPVPQSAPAPTPDATFDAFNPPAPAPAPAAPVFDAFNPPPSAFTGSDPALLQQFNLPSGSFIPGSSPLADLRRRREAGQRSKIVQLENLSFQERLARSQAGSGPLFNRVALVPLPPEQDELDAGISGAGSSSPPAPPSPPTGQDELDARPPGNEEPIISPAPRRLAPSGEGFSLPSPFEGTAETVGGIASIADTALGLGLGPAAGIGANLLTQAGQFANIPERQRGSLDAGEAVSSLLPFGLGGDNIETQFANLTSQDELNAGESIPNIPTGQDELDAGIVDDFSDFKNFQGFEGRSDGLIGFGFEDFEGGLPFDPDTAAPGSREEAFLQTINPDFKATGSGAQPLQRINEAAVLPESQIPFFDAFNPPAPDPAFFADLGLPGDPFDAFNPDLGLPDDAFNPDLAGAVPIIPGDPFFDAFNPPSNVGGFRPIGPQLQNPVFDAFDPPAPDTTFDAFDPPAPDTTFDAFDPPTPALSRNPEEAERQVKAANITQAVEAQNPGSLGRERVRSASQVLRENFDRKRGDTTFDAFNPSSLESGVQVAGLGDIVDFFTPESRIDQARRRAEESAARRRRGVPPAGLQRAQEAAALTNPVSGGVPAQGAVPNVTLGEELVPSSREVIRALAAPDGKGGIKPEADRGILDRILSNFRQGTPSATTQLPPQFDQEAANARFIAQQAELDRRDAERARLAAGQGGGASNTGQLEEGNQGTGRGVFLEFLKQLGIGGAAGGLVGLMRKGN